MSNEVAPKFSLLFSGNRAADVRTIFRYLDEYGVTIGVPHLDINTNKIIGLVGALTEQFPWPPGHEKASPFKKAAAFTTSFVPEKPTASSLPATIYGELATHQNAIFAYDFCISALHNAEIICPRRGKIVLKNRVEVSYHYWRDLIVALSACNMSQHFHMVSLIYESLVYQANPEASYDRVM